MSRRAAKADDTRSASRLVGASATARERGGIGARLGGEVGDGCVDGWWSDVAPLWLGLALGL